MTVRKAFFIYVDLDSVPGTMNTERSALNVVRAIVLSNASHYNPNVSLAPEYAQPENSEGRLRRAFLVYINLDPIPGLMHSQESVQNVLRNLMHNRISHYNPSVSLASNDFQHTTETEGNSVA